VNNRLKFEDSMEWKRMWENKGNENLKATISVEIITDQTQLENAEYFNYLGSIIINDARRTCEINPGLSWQKQHSTRRRLFMAANRTQN